MDIETDDIELNNNNDVKFGTSNDYKVNLN